MLTKPKAGWSTVIIFGKNIGSASYLDDVANITLDAFIKYFSDAEYNLSISFDAEGWNFGLVSWNDELYVISTDDSSIHLVEKDGNYISLREVMLILAEELISDVEDNIIAWSFWNPGTYYDEAEIEKENLSKKCSQLRDLVAKEKEKEQKNELKNL